ncbi:MAG: NADH-quinone oxidoreductase subunit NuoK [Thermoplasmata archaeon]|nr:NADH-quinone oxidoreductase subunit NuoK [Thermoplasmata archaeon]
MAPSARACHAGGPRRRDLPRAGGAGLTELSPEAFLALSAALLGIGVFGILTRRNFILLLIAIEIAMNAAILNFVYFAAFSGSSQGLSGQAIAVVVVGLAATEVAVGLAIVLALNRLRGSINVAEASALKL